nr:DNA methyltransferase [uncultured Roseateles sp.]
MVRVQAAERIAPTMTPVEFVRKWGQGTKADRLNERAGAQSHFNDLCSVLGVPSPTDHEDDGYCFEQGFQGVVGRQLYADVWKRGCFAWEYKRPGADLRQALQQLMQYALPLENPPLLVVSDRRRIEIHTHFTGWPSISHEFRHEQLLEPKVTARLRQIFTDPEQFRPERSSRQLTTDLATRFAQLADGLRRRGEDSFKVAHFLTQCVFCCFAEDVNLLRNNEFRQVVQRRQDPERLKRKLAELFAQMRTGGDFGVDEIAWFNGGLFAEVDVPTLTLDEIKTLGEAAEADWRAIDPTILGTLFERGLDPSKADLVGAHFTDPATIEKLIDPVLRKPLLAEWSAVRDEISGLLSSRDYMNVRARGVPSKNPELHPRYAALRSQASRAANKAEALFSTFLERLKNYRVLDPACGSGNFLYLALRALKDIELQANLDAERIGLQRQIPHTGPQNVLGIEKNEFAAELARVTVWIGELQWLRDNGLTPDERPVLKPLNQIECRDALMDADGGEAGWPQANVVVGNPPFVGDKKMRSELGDPYTDALRTTFKGRLPGGADLVCYWFEKARAQLNGGELERAGFVATNSIRGGKNRQVLDRLVGSTAIFEAWGDEVWINEGAAVRVSLIAFGGTDQEVRLDGQNVTAINSDLSSRAADLTRAQRLLQNRGGCYYATVKAGSFDVSGEAARAWLELPNPHGRSNADVVKPWMNAMDLTRRPADKWVVDFGVGCDIGTAILYEEPFAHVLAHVKPERDNTRRDKYRRIWWEFAEPIPGMRSALSGLDRYIATPALAKHRLFAWVDAQVIPDHALMVIARADDSTFGVLHSRFHEIWSLRLGTSLEDRPRYTPTTCFETYPFPTEFAPCDTASQRTEALQDGALIPSEVPASARGFAIGIATAAKRLTDLRERWLNPPQWCKRVSDVVPAGMKRSPYADRFVARPGFEKELARRTLTNLYNLRPAWLIAAHEALDAAVAAAYGWADYTPRMSDDEILGRLLKLNLERAESQPGTQKQLALLAAIASPGETAAIQPRSSGRKASKRAA